MDLTGQTASTFANPAIIPPDKVQIWGRCDAAGNTLDISGATISRTAVGRYDVVFTIPRSNADYPIVLGAEDTNDRDDISVYYLNVTLNGFRIQITEQDNGGTAGTFRDRSVSFYCPSLV